MTPRQQKVAEAILSQREREERIQAYVWARVLRGHDHKRASKELIPLA